MSLPMSVYIYKCIYMYTRLSIHQTVIYIYISRDVDINSQKKQKT